MSKTYAESFEEFFVKELDAISDVGIKNIFGVLKEEALKNGFHLQSITLDHDNRVTDYKLVLIKAVSAVRIEVQVGSNERD